MCASMRRRSRIPVSAKSFVFAVAGNLLITKVRHEQVVPFEVVADVVHLVSQRLSDRSSELDRLSEDRFRHQMRSDQILPLPDSCEMYRHPRNVRVLPKSRDFH